MNNFNGKADVIDFKIYGDDLQFVEVELDPQESVVAEAGAMMMMEQGIQLETIFGDGSAQSNQGGLMGKFLNAGKRVITGESLFMTLFTNSGSGKQHVSFAAPYPGKIIPVYLPDYNGKIICQKDAFLCAAKGVSIGIDFKRKLGVGFFGGEGFIMEKLEGDGLAFLHVGGTTIEKELGSGETLRVDTGCLAAMTGSIKYDIQYVGNVKTAFFGGEGLFFATLTGPGKVWVQSLPFSRLADRIYGAAKGRGGARKEESNVFDLMGGIGNMFSGD
jgi:uncharacterized protein (TIGR00266 family)